MAEASSLQPLIGYCIDTQCSAAEQASIVQALSLEVVHDRLTIQSLVITLGAYLTTSDNAVRDRGTLLLSDILANLSGKSLEDTAVKSLTNFYSARLGDWHCLRGAVLGSLSLLRRRSEVGAVEAAEANEVANSALAVLHVQALAQPDRMLCLELFECLLEEHADAIAPLEGDLIFGVVAAIEGETDPRCLLLAFRIIQLLARLYPDHNGPMASCADELFDVVSRYFPISFSPQSVTLGSVTREDLATALKEAFACTPIFAPYCISLLLGKLSSSLRYAKLDSLNCLGHCGLVYGAKALRKYTIPVWEALKAELLPVSVPLLSTSSEPQVAEIVKEALSCLSNWILAFQSEKYLSEVVMNDSGIMESGDFLRLVLQDGLVEDLISNLESFTGGQGRTEFAMKDLAKHQSRAAGRVLAESARTSPSSCFVICKEVLRRLISASGLLAEKKPSARECILQGHKVIIYSSEIPLVHAGTASPPVICPSGGQVISYEDRDRFGCDVGLEVVLEILIAARSLAEKLFQEHQSSSMTSRKWLNPLREQSENLITAFHQAITDEWSKVSSVLGVGGLQALASFPAPLSPLSSNQLRRILVILKDLLFDGTKQILLTNVSMALEKISSVEEQSGTMDRHVGISTVVAPDLLKAVREAKTGAVVGKNLRALAKISGPRSVTRQLVIRHLIGSIHIDLSGADENEEVYEICAKLVVILQCLSEDLLPWCDCQGADQSDTMGLSMEIFSIVSAQTINCNQEVLRWSVKAIRVAVLKCDAQVQGEILRKGIELLFETEHHDEEEVDWSIALVAAVIVSLRPSATVPNKQTLLNTLMRAALSEKPFFITETAAQAVASMLNKWVATSTDEADGLFNMETAVNMVLGEVCLSEIFLNAILEIPEDRDTERNVPCRSMLHMVSMVRAAAWIGKGLAMRGHNGISVVVSVLLRLLLSEAFEEGKEFNLAMAAAESLGIIVRDAEFGLNKAHHAVVRPLYKQRFFNSMLSPLLEAVRSSRNTSAKLRLYRGIGHLMSGTPHIALLADGAHVFPLILETLSYLYSERSDSELLQSTLLALSTFLLDVCQGMSTVAEHVSSTVKQMLTLIQYQYSVVVRETALRCLGAAVGLSYTQVYPLRAEVSKAISAALDDKKRVVRKEADSRCALLEPFVMSFQYQILRARSSLQNIWDRTHSAFSKDLSLHSSTSKS